MYPYERSLVEEMQGRPFVLLGVNTDEKLSRAKKAIRDNKLNWRSFWDGRPGGPITRQFGIRAYPTILLIDHNGVIQFKDRRDLDDKVKFLVARAEGSGDATVNYDPVTVTKTPEYRTFTDSSGEHKVWAKFQSYDGTNVVLVMEDGNDIELALRDLSRRDQDFLDENGFLLSELKETSFGGTEFRTFTSSNGEYQVNAKLIGIQGDMITLELEDGASVPVTMEDLSTEDQQYIRRKKIEQGDGT